MGRVPRISIAKAVWTTKLSSRMHAMYIIKLNLSARPTFDAAERHVALYKARMPWKRSEFNKQIVPGYIHPVPERKEIRINPAYLDMQPQNMNARHLSNFPTDLMSVITETFIDKLDNVYAFRTPWKMIRRPFLDYIYGEAGYAFEK